MAIKPPREKNMSNKGQLLQDPFLNTLRKEHVPVSIYLVNGIKLQGQIESFDQYVVLLRNSVTQMVYKHAISTVVPSRARSRGAQRRLRDFQPCAFPGAGKKRGKGAAAARDGPYRADSRNLRPARADQRRQAAGRA